MRISVVAGIYCAVSCLLLGCQKDAGDSVLRFVEMPDYRVFVKVNGEDVRFGDLRKQIAFEEAVRRIRLEKSSANDIEEQLRNFRIWRRTSIVPEFINGVLVEQEARKKGIVADHDRVESAVARFVGDLKAISEDDFLKRAGMSKTQFEEVMAKDVRRDMLLEKLYPDIVDISSNEMREVTARFVAFNAVADATNAIQKAECSRIVEEVKSGLSFEKAFDKYNQVAPLSENGCEWGDFYKRELKDNERLQNWAFTAPVGSVAGPFEWEDGFVIVRISDRTQGTTEEYSVSAAVSSVHLQRITLCMSESIPIPEGAELVKQISGARRVESLVELIGRLHGEMKLEYPNGTVIDGDE